MGLHSFIRADVRAVPYFRVIIARSECPEVPAPAERGKDDFLNVSSKRQISPARGYGGKAARSVSFEPQ